MKVSQRKRKVRVPWDPANQDLVDDKSKIVKIEEKFVPTQIETDDPSIVVQTDDDNPWAFKTFNDFLYYNCPECNYKSQKQEKFAKHAERRHPKAKSMMGPKVEVAVIDFNGDEPTVLFEEKENTVGVDMPTWPLDENIKVVEVMPAEKPIYTGDWQCYLCGLIDPDRKAILKHLTDKHDKRTSKDKLSGPPRDFQCNECHAMYPTNNALIIHTCGVVTRAHGVGGFQCEKCDEKFPKRPQLLKHMHKVHGEERKFACDQCEYRAMTPTLLMNHKKARHTTLKPFLCTECGMSFKLRKYLTDHQRIVHDKDKYLMDNMCFTCGLVNQSKPSLATHLEEIHFKTVNRTPSKDPMTPFKCESCLDEFYDLKTLREHLKVTHADIRPKVPSNSANRAQQPRSHRTCHFCGKVFTITGLKLHIESIHQKIRHPCDMCGKTFSSESSLRRHKFTHTDPRFECALCNKKMFTNDALRRHIKTVHEKNEVYSCNACDFQSYYQYSVKAHIQQVHQKYRPLKCDHCDEAFFYKRDREKHMLKTHQLAAVVAV